MHCEQNFSPSGEKCFIACTERTQIRLPSSNLLLKICTKIYNYISDSFAKKYYTKHWQQIVCFWFIFICLLALLWIGSFFGIKPMNHRLYPCPNSALHYYFLSWSLDSRTSFKCVKSWRYREIKNNKFVILKKLPLLLVSYI